jgi:hypothetical protein
LRLAALILTASAAPTHAAESVALDRFYLAVGNYESRNEIHARWDSPTGIPGSDLDFQRDFGFRPDTRERLWELGGMPVRDHEFKAFGYDYRARGRRVLAGTFLIDDVEYRANGDFAGSIAFGIRGFSYTWYPSHNDDRAIGFGLGAVHHALTGYLAASADVNGASASVERRFTEDAWLPLLRVALAQRWSAHWRGGLELAYVRKPSGSVCGDARLAAIRLDYLPTRHLGLSLRYHLNAVDLDLNGRRFSGRLHVENRGPQLLAMLRW